MARVLSFQRTIVPSGDRAKYLARLKARQTYYTSARCRFWTFEETDLHGAFIEFIEAEDENTLTAALAHAPDQFVEAVRIYREVELT